MVTGQILGALVLSYLETHHPAPWDETMKRCSLPVSVDFDELARILNVSRRTLGLSFTQIARWFASEEKRISAVRSGREFLAHERTRYRKVLLYSVVGAKRFCVPHRTIGEITIRRNVPVMAQVLEQCGLTHIRGEQMQRMAESARHVQDVAGAPPSTLGTLPELLMRGVELAGDRRKTRHLRLRKAREHGLLGEPEPQNDSGKLTVSVDPELAAIAARIEVRNR